MKHVTIKDIARSLCISVSTVSRALTDDKNIRRETREAVLREAERLGYRRNPVAMNLKMGRTNTIGVIVPEMHTPYASQVVAGIQSVLYKNNQKVMIAESDESPLRERESLQMMEEFMVDGLIVSLCSYKQNVDVYRRLAAAGSVGAALLICMVPMMSIMRWSANEATVRRWRNSMYTTRSLSLRRA